MKIVKTKEYKKLQEQKDRSVPPWKKWGPYVSDRAWGTVREDYSEDGNAWEYFPCDHAPHRTYRWGEDAIAGLCDRYQTLVFGWAFWNEKDPILKERLFGLGTWEGNHGEDVKEYYYYLDAVPSFSYCKYLYKYPMEEFPYKKLYEENKKRSAKDLEYELVDTGIFEQDRYFDIFIEYAKESCDDICIKVEIFNRSDEEAPLHILPQLTFRNQWSWGEKPLPEPKMVSDDKKHYKCIVTDDSDMQPPKRLAVEYHLKKMYFYGSPNAESLFTNNETNRKKLWDQKNTTPYVKDAFHQKIVHKKKATNPDLQGTKACFHCIEKIPAKSSKVLYFRLSQNPLKSPLKNIEKIFIKRKKEADEYYASIQPKKASIEEKKIQRQAFAGMLWSQQVYLYDVSTWLVGDNPKKPAPKSRSSIRNNRWRHLNSMRLFSMPDKWEYPWFAAWDLAFQTTTLAYVDMAFAKEQLWLLLFDQFQHPNGQIPAYEWEFSDVNPPVQAWAALKIFHLEEKLFGKKDFDFLEKCFHKLLLNFSWWINRIDASGKNVFEGGFLGLDNITLLDRSKKNEEGCIDEADGAGWMAMFCFHLMSMSLLLSEKNHVYETLATKFFEHYVYIAAALRKGYWRTYDMLDAEDKFFYSVFRYKDGSYEQFKIRSLVGIIPLFACGTLDDDYIKKFPHFYKNFHWFYKNRTALVEKCVHNTEVSGKKIHLFSLIFAGEIEKFLGYIWDPNEFRSDFGLRSLSKYHEKNPFTDKGKSIGYEPGESLVRIKGGNSNWRGPIWFPTTYLLIDTLDTLSKAIKEKVKIKVANEKEVDIQAIADGYAERLISLFKKDAKGLRPIFGKYKKLQEDPHFQDHLLFYEHYHGDTGRGLGASHQTGWSGLVANIIQEFRDD